MLAYDSLTVITSAASTTPCQMGEDRDTNGEVVSKQVQSYICSVCSAKFEKKEALHSHINQFHTDVLLFLCDQCPKRFSEACQLTRHSKLHDPTRYQGDPQFCCEFCGKSYHLKISLTNHRKLKHFGYIPPKNSTQNETKQTASDYPCRHCGKIFASLSNRRHHETTHNPHRYKGEPQFACHLCDKKYHLRGSLKTHKLYAHQLQKRLSQKERYQPLQNNSIGTFKTILGDMPIICDLCQKRFAHRSSLNKHKRSVHNYFPAVIKESLDCPHCPRRFPYPNQLKAHLRLHTGELPHQCHSCEMRFRTMGGLRAHEKDHIANPLNTYKCRFCGKEGFKTFTRYNDHRKNAHARFPYQSENERPFGCGICGKPYFLREDAIICALLKHDPKRLQEQMFRFKCIGCPDEYLAHRSFLALRNHWELEHGDMPIPSIYRNGINNPNLKDELPTVTLDKVKAREIKDKGIPSEVKYEFPLYVEFDLLQFAPEENLKTFQCSICNKMLASERGLKRHHVTYHVNGWTRKVKPRECLPRDCSLCSMTFASRSNLRRHLLSNLHRLNLRNKSSTGGMPKVESYVRQDNAKRRKLSKSEKQVGRKLISGNVPAASLKQEVGLDNGMESVQEDDFMEGWKDVPVKMETVEGIEYEDDVTNVMYVFVREKSVSRKTVNVKDLAGIKRLLGNKEVRLVLTRVNEILDILI